MSSHETWEVIGTDGRGDKNNVVRGNEWIAYTANEVTARRIAKLPDLERRVVELETLLRQSEEQNDVLMQTLEDVNAS